MRFKRKSAPHRPRSSPPKSRALFPRAAAHLLDLPTREEFLALVDRYGEYLEEMVEDWQKIVDQSVELLLTQQCTDAIMRRLDSHLPLTEDQQFANEMALTSFAIGVKVHNITPDPGIEERIKKELMEVTRRSQLEVDWDRV